MLVLPVTPVIISLTFASIVPFVLERPFDPSSLCFPRFSFPTFSFPRTVYPSHQLGRPIDFVHYSLHPFVFDVVPMPPLQVHRYPSLRRVELVCTNLAPLRRIVLFVSSNDVV